MGITIERQQRDAIYQEVVLDLNGLTDLWTEFDQGNYERARELRTRFGLDMRLLDDLGWEPDPEGDEFELTMDGVDLAAVVSYLVVQTGAILHTHIVEPIERTPHAETDRDRGELQERTTTTFLRYLDEWIERYRGQGRRGFRENTRDEYRRLIANYAKPYFPGKLKLIDVTPYRLARFVDWLADPDEQGKQLCDRSIANITNPLRAALATAKREGLIRHNPAQGLALPHREQIIDQEQEVKVFSRDQLAAVLSMAPDRHRLLFELLATTGLRISEAIALQRLHLQLDGSKPEVCIRRAIVKDRIEPPKTKYGRREILLPDSLALRLRAHFAEQADQDSTALAFTNEAGATIDPNNLRRRILKPLVEEVNAPWAGFHTFRHTFASIHLSEGTNLLQLSRALGHHSAAFTLSRYTHLLPGDEAPALDLAAAGRPHAARTVHTAISGSH